MSKDEKSFNKILANQIQQHTKSIHKNQLEFTPGTWGWFRIQNQSVDLQERAA